jgi:hypothetical protein
MDPVEVQKIGGVFMSGVHRQGTKIQRRGFGQETFANDFDF